MLTKPTNFPKVEGLEDFPAHLAKSLLAEVSTYESSRRPYWIQVIGIPGSGKTTLVHMLQRALNENAPYTLAAFDQYMEQIPEYQKESDRVAAFAKFEASARAFGFEMFRELISRKINVLFEHSTTFPAVKDLMYFVKQSNYRFVLIRVVVDVSIAKKRVLAREQITLRHVPESVIEERAHVADSRWDELSKIADAKFTIVNNGDQTPKEAFKDTVAKVADFVNTLE